jgi:lysophospholipase L1-like esterase
MQLLPVRIILVGDSTMAVRSGWGPGFCTDVVEQVTCINMAKGGRSSGSYRAEGSWEKVLEEIKHNSDFKATYVLIQFGHNDQPGKPGRSTDLATEFPVNMQRYVQDVIANGAKPVLITPLTRRWFKDGKVRNDLEPWALATKKVAAEMGVPLLDLNADSVAAIQQMGPVEANTLAMAPPPPVVAESAASGNSVPAPKPQRRETAAPATNSVAETSANNAAERKGPAAPTFDYTHLGAKGSALFGRMIADELAKAVPDLRPYIKMASATTAPDSTPATNVTLHPALFLVGDSIMQTGTGNGEHGRWGWGSEIIALFDPAKIHVYNEAHGGRSSRGYIEEGLWGKILERMQPGDFVIVQFGHNDSANSQNYPDRTTITGGGDETIQCGVGSSKKVIHTYGWYLRQYVADTKAKGAIPIICSPVPRNTWSDGKIKRDFDGYAQWAADAAETTGAFFIDLNSIVANRYDSLGEKKAAALFADHQHTTKAGARLNAEAVVEGLNQLKGCLLVNYLAPVSSATTPVQ